MKFTPAIITKLDPGQVFVFGSNEAGRHRKGAAQHAQRYFGAINGQGDGLQGQSYGISTKDRNLKVLSLARISYKVERFIRFAEAHPEKEFLVTKIGCGLAGKKPIEIAPMFKEALKLTNVILPEEFYNILTNSHN